MRIISLAIFLILQTLLFAQPNIPVRIEGHSIVSQSLKNADITYLTFKGAVNLKAYGAVPFYKSTVTLPDRLFDCEIDIRIQKIDTLDNVIANSITDNELIDTSFKTIVFKEGQEASIYVMPYRKTSKGIERLLDFEVLIEYVPSESTDNRRSMNTNYANQSKLSIGTWFKLGITETGIHSLSYDDLNSMGINPSDMDVENIGIFGNYNGVLPEANSKFRKDDLEENSIKSVGLEDGKFDEGDLILFYAQAALTWSYNPFTGRFVHNNNFYADTTYYFFTPDSGSKKNMSVLDGTSEVGTYVVTSFTDKAVHEVDLENMISSGKEWYGERFEGDTLERTFNFSFPNLKLDEPLFLSLEIIGRAYENSYYDVYVNDQQVVDSTKIRFITPTLGIFGRKSTSNATFFSDSDNLDVKLVFKSGDPNAIGWLDFLLLNAERELIFKGNQMEFSNPHTAATGNVSEFRVAETTSDDEVWDITDIHNPKKVLTNFEDATTVFTLPTDSLKTFTIYDGNSFLKPVSYDIVSNQNLHGITDVNFVIIRPDFFSDYAEEVANIHRYHDDLKTITVGLTEIYNEFSSGSQDISAIRDFMRMLYKKDAFGNERAYLLLFGDASFDYKDRIHDNTNLVPTYESLESLRETGTFATDDYFGLLDDSEGANASGDLDVGIGRFPISTIQEAQTTVEKIENYLVQNNKVMSKWRTDICFIADDRDNNLHLIQAEDLVDITDTLFNGIGIKKIFLDAYNKVTVPGGFRYPDVNRKINEQISQGALIVNYTGHGGLIGWSNELVLDVPMINAFDNFDNLPLIITATCEFSRFDDPEFKSAGEYVFLNENGGGIGLLTTTRLAYAHSNFIMNSRIYSNLLSCDDEGSVPRLGDLIRLSKIPSNENFLNFTLLGDPALTLAYPKYIVETENVTTTDDNDTIHALSIVNVSGRINDATGNLQSNFNGFLYPEVYDKATNYTTLGNDGNSFPQDFTLFDRLLYDGRVLVENGRFEFDFKVPKNIIYSYGNGKILYYALDTVSYTDAWGGFESLLIGGVDENADLDDIGPDINLYLNSSQFSNMDVVTSNPVLFSKITDDNGINNTGIGLGRDMVMILDNDYSNPLIMNEFFSMDLNSYKSGQIVYPMSNLSSGLHTLKLKVWDLYNNSSEKTIEFIVNDEAEISLRGVYNYPNPFTEETEFTFNHNKSGVELNVVIRIYDITGNFVVELSNENNINGNIIWNGKNSNNNRVPAGLYTYTLEVTDEYGNVTVQQQKLIKLSK
jgi:hypothetical protein